METAWCGLRNGRKAKRNMSAQPTTSKYSQRYLGNNTSKKEVHDIQNEKKQCQADEIIAAGHGVRFIPDALDEAHRCGYDNCAYCLGGSTR